MTDLHRAIEDIQHRRAMRALEMTRGLPPGEHPVDQHMQQVADRLHEFGARLRLLHEEINDFDMSEPSLGMDTLAPEKRRELDRATLAMENAAELLEGW